MMSGRDPSRCCKLHQDARIGECRDWRVADGPEEGITKSRKRERAVEGKGRRQGKGKPTMFQRQTAGKWQILVPVPGGLGFNKWSIRPCYTLDNHCGDQRISITLRLC